MFPIVAPDQLPYVPSETLISTVTVLGVIVNSFRASVPA